MIQGTRNWRNMKRLGYVQCRADGDYGPNAAVEQMLAKHNAATYQTPTSNRDNWLETCGSHTAANLTVAIHPDPQTWLEGFKVPGGALVRPPDVLTMWMNTPENAEDINAGAALDPAKMPSMANEYRALFPYCVRRVFGVEAEYHLSVGFADAKSAVLAGYGVMLGLNIGHFIGAYAYDDATDELIYVDPDPHFHIADGNWWAARMGQKEYSSTVSDSFVVFKGML